MLLRNINIIFQKSQKIKYLCIYIRIFKISIYVYIFKYLKTTLDIQSLGFYRKICKVSFVDFTLYASVHSVHSGSLNTILEINLWSSLLLISQRLKGYHCEFGQSSLHRGPLPITLSVPLTFQNFKYTFTCFWGFQFQTIFFLA